MKDTLQKKLLIPLAILALVAVGGTVYTLSHSGPSTVHAQQAVGQQAPDKETNDDNTVKPAINSSVDKPEANDKPDVKGTQDQPDTQGENDTNRTE